MQLERLWSRRGDVALWWSLTVRTVKMIVKSLQNCLDSVLIREIVVGREIYEITLQNMSDTG